MPSADAISLAIQYASKMKRINIARKLTELAQTRAAQEEESGDEDDVDVESDQEMESENGDDNQGQEQSDDDDDDVIVEKQTTTRKIPQIPK